MSLDRPMVVDPTWVERHEHVALVDVRERRDYVDGDPIAGAVNAPFDSFRDPPSVAAGTLPGRETFADLLGTAGITNGETLVAYDDVGGVHAARFLLTTAVYGHDGSCYLVDGGTLFGYDADGDGLFARESTRSAMRA